LDDVNDDRVVPAEPGGSDPDGSPAPTGPSPFAGSLFDMDEVVAKVGPEPAAPAPAPAPGPAPTAAAPEVPLAPAPTASAPAVIPVEPARAEDYAAASAQAARPIAPEVAPAESPQAASQAAPASQTATPAAAAVPAPAPAPAQPAPEPPPGTQASLLAPEDVPVAVAAIPPAAAAKTQDLTGATNVATYGDKDLDEIMAEIARKAAAAGAAEAAVGATVAAQDAAAAQPVAPVAEGANAPFVVVEGDEPADDEMVVQDDEVTAARAPWWPFLVCAGVWLVFAAGLAWIMKTPAASGNLFDSPYYRVFLYGGLALGVVGLLLVLIVWLVYRRRYPKGGRGGLFSSAMIKGALMIFIGVALWWAAYYGAVWLATSAK
jgi:hypothetical protein